MKDQLEKAWNANVVFNPSHITFWVINLDCKIIPVCGQRVEFSNKWKKRQQRRIARTQRKR